MDMSTSPWREIVALYRWSILAMPNAIAWQFGWTVVPIARARL